MTKLDDKADILFDVLVQAAPDGVLSKDLRAALEANGFKTTFQTVAETVMHLRRLLSDSGKYIDTEVITCVRGGKNSMYFIAMTPKEALQYRRVRSTHISTLARTLIAQVQTERTRFGGEIIFTNAAVDYFNAGIRELERAASISVMKNP